MRGFGYHPRQCNKSDDAICEQELKPQHSQLDIGGIVGTLPIINLPTHSLSQLIQDVENGDEKNLKTCFTLQTFHAFGDRCHQQSENAIAPSVN